MLIIDEKFAINCEGQDTKQRYTGDFAARRYLSQNLKMQRSRLIREFLGEFAHYATDQDRLRAIALAECIVYLSSAPDWWKQANNGIELKDDNVVDEVWAGIAKVTGRTRAEQEKKANADAAALRDAVENGESVGKTPPPTEE